MKFGRNGGEDFSCRESVIQSIGRISMSEIFYYTPAKPLSWWNDIFNAREGWERNYVFEKQHKDVCGNACFPL